MLTSKLSPDLNCEVHLNIYMEQALYKCITIFFDQFFDKRFMLLEFTAYVAGESGDKDNAILVVSCHSKLLKSIII